MLSLVTAGIIDTGGKFTAGVAVSGNFDYKCEAHLVLPVYRRLFAHFQKKIIEIELMGLLGKIIHERNMKSKISLPCPFKGNFHLCVVLRVPALHYYTIHVLKAEPIGIFFLFKLLTTY